RDFHVTGVQTCALPISASLRTPTGPAVAAGSMVGDGQPRFDDCSMLPVTVAMSGRNVGDLLNARGVTWGWFQGGFAPSSVVGGKIGRASCRERGEVCGG